MRKKTIIPAVVLIIAVAGGVIAFMPGSKSKPSSAVPPVPITAGMAEVKDVPVYLTGLGTVQAFNTVTVNTRVDGQLDKVNFTEGQDVKAGDVLAQIDPRPFQAALDLAQATRAKDQAQLANARLDLQRYQKAGTLANTQQQIDTQAALVQQLEATVKADQANIEAAQVQLDYTTIKAPISGRTGARLVDQGNIIHATSGSRLTFESGRGFPADWMHASLAYANRNFHHSQTRRSPPSEGALAGSQHPAQACLAG
jgi:multidrug efflux system membrane fusion protein